VARQEEVGVERVGEARLLHRPPGGDEGLGEYLPAEDALRAEEAVLPPEDVDLDGFEVEQVEEIGEGSHRQTRKGRGTGRLRFLHAAFPTSSLSAPRRRSGAGRATARRRRRKRRRARTRGPGAAWAPAQFG